MIVVPGGGRRRSLGLAAVLMAALGWAALSGTPGPERSALAAPLRATNPGAAVDFSLVLRAPDPRRLDRFLAGLYDPASPVYHHFIGAAAFGARFGVSSRLLRGVTAQLARDGVAVTASYPQRTAIDARAPAAVVERLFAVRMMDYRGLGNRRFHAPVGQPVIPPDLRQAVSAVAGLDGNTMVRAADVPSGGVSPAVGRIAYNTLPLYGQGVSGEGEKVAIISLASYSQSDLNRFDQRFGLGPLTPRSIPVDGGAGDVSAGNESEV
jgi:subtilase family serine protease